MPRITSPVITSVNKNVYIGEDNFQISGATIASTTIHILLKSTKGDTVADLNAKPDDNGNWHAQLTQGVQSGDYYFEIRAIDGRGAMSLPVKSDTFSVSIRPFLVIGSLQLSIGWFFGLIIVLLLIGGGGTWKLLRLQSQQKERKAIIAQRDIANAVTIMKKDIDSILAKYSDDRIDETEISEIRYLAKKIGENLDKARKYIVEDVGDINK